MTFQNELIDKTSATLSRINWSCIGAMIILLLITSFAQKNIPIAVTAETAAKLYLTAIVIAIIFIPLSNWLFNKRIKRISSNEPTELSLRIYRVAFYSRLVLVCSAFVVNLLLYFFSSNTHLLIIGAIFIVYQMIAIPSKDSLFEIIGIEANEKEADQTL
ncbi:hypothetical protein [Acetobacteroides hydrogenigenes]|uniref:Uncharacterized protein n=1 Tax=Acetobacteroides hydrogenigenes TaxID=979970 RepID=A0A4R2EQF9_9BACT|nr:hypothetical protein [Acetobacteroides hydrogenigenes]TCN66669.1 hypothetical protein CLV25_1087 [Acetobacteroides hydrogenigenes]